LLVYRVDRLARSVRTLAHILEELDEAGVAFRSATEPFDTSTPGGRMFVQMLGVFAEFERATIVERVIAGMERKAATGGWPGGYRPFGYEPDPETGLLVVKEDEAPLVPVIFDLYANKRMGSRAVAQWLNRRGHRTKAGRPWGHTAVLTVLTNRAYVGEIFFRGRYHPAPHPRLVDAKLFETAQAVLESRGEDMALRRTNGSEYLLTGLLVCQKCGKRFIGASAKGNAYKYAYYVCFSRHRYGTQECDQDRLRADELEDRVVESLLATLGRRDLLRKPSSGGGRSWRRTGRTENRISLRWRPRSDEPRDRWITTSRPSRRGGSGRTSAPDASRSSRRSSHRSRPGALSWPRRYRRVSRVSRTPPSSRSSSGTSSAPCRMERRRSARL
jgi:site-specific DNA recombinase